MAEQSLVWKPKPWIAACLGLFMFPLGVVYVGRVRLAAGYLTLALGAIGLDFVFGFFPPEKEPYITLAVVVGSAIHAVYLAVKASPRERLWWSRWYGMGTFFAAMVVTIALIRSFLFEPFHIPAQSMSPWLPKGSHIIVAKLGFGNYGTFGQWLPHFGQYADVRRGDVVVFKYPEDERISFVKRVVAVGGDSIEYRNKRIHVNGLKLTGEPDEVRGEYELSTEESDTGSFRVMAMPSVPSQDFSFQVPADHYFVMGDNRDNSRDSRYWGTVPGELLIGRVVLAIRSAGH